MTTLLFDLDGTLIDSVPLWIEANLSALRTYGVTMEYAFFLHAFYQKGFHYSGIAEKCGVHVTKIDAFYAERDNLFSALIREKATWIGNAENVLQTCAETMSLGMQTGSRM